MTFITSGRRIDQIEEEEVAPISTRPDLSDGQSIADAGAASRNQNVADAGVFFNELEPLTEAQPARQIGRRKEIYEALHLETRQG